MHSFQLGGDLLERAVGRGRGDAGDEPDQSIVAALLGSAIQQSRFDDALGREPPTVRRSRSAVQPASGPRFRTRTTSPQGCCGRIRRTVGSHPSIRSSRAVRCALSRLARTFRIASGSLARSPGLPPTRPWLRAVRRPALVRSAMSARSSWATAPRTRRENMPSGWWRRPDHAGCGNARRSLRAARSPRAGD